MAQQVEQVISVSDGWRFNLWLLQSASRCVLGWDTESSIAPHGFSIIAPVEQVAPDMVASSTSV